MSHLFSPLEFHPPRGTVALANRLVIAPMCQYSADEGRPTDWHLMHWANLFNSGASFVIIEATAVSPEGRITPGCLGLWDDTTTAAFADTLQRARRLAPPLPVCVQLSHAGRKASSEAPWRGGMLIPQDKGGWQHTGPSAIAHLPDEPAPRELTLAEIQTITQDFIAAARRAQAIGLEGIEIHGAHGYLLHEFLSPLANQRTDAYGGTFDNRVRLLMDIFQGIRTVFDGVLGVRLSATDWVEGGWNADETIELTHRLKAAGADYVHISSGGVSSQQKIPIGPNYQVPFAQQVKTAAGLPTIAVGLITEPQQAEDILARGEADMVAIARSVLYKPHWGWEAAAALGGQVAASPPYWRSIPRDVQAIFGKIHIGMR